MKIFEKLVFKQHYQFLSDNNNRIS